jgi:hypothetical protein
MPVHQGSLPSFVSGRARLPYLMCCVWWRGSKHTLNFEFVLHSFDEMIETHFPHGEKERKKLSMVTGLFSNKFD